VIWVTCEGKSFCGRDWTAKITLIGLNKLVFWRDHVSVRKLDTWPPHFVNRGLWSTVRCGPTPIDLLANLKLAI
jgi:hypothetical protein